MSNIMHSTKDNIHYQVGEYDFWLKPLTKPEKDRLTKNMTDAGKGDMVKASEAVRESIKMSLRRVKGFLEYDEFDELVEFKLSFDDNNEITNDCLDTILNNPINPILQTLCSSLIHGIQTQFVNADADTIEGIKFIDDRKKKTTAKKTKKK